MAGAKGQRSFQVEFGQHFVTVRHLLERQGGQACGHGLGVGPAMCLHQTDDQGHTLRMCRPCRSKHGEGLAHASASAQKDLEPASMSARFIGLHSQEQVVWVRAIKVRGHGVCGSMLSGHRRQPWR
jgi:hypothetical protein